MKSAKKQNNITVHHIIPQSRGYDESEENKTKISEREHDLYHAIFVNRTPIEIIDYLVKNFWNCQIKWVVEYLEQQEKLKR